MFWLAVLRIGGFSVPVGFCFGRLAELVRGEAMYDMVWPTAIKVFCSVDLFGVGTPTLVLEGFGVPRLELGISLSSHGKGADWLAGGSRFLGFEQVFHT